MNIVTRDDLVRVLGRIATYVEAYAAKTPLNERYAAKTPLNERELLLDLIDAALLNVRRELDMERGFTNDARARAER